MAELSPVSFLADVQPGDVIAFSGRSCLSRAIQCCTLGSISHVGIVAMHPAPKSYCIRLYESILTHGVRRIHLALDVKTALDGGCRVWHYPLAKPLSRGESLALTRFLEAIRTAPTPYDRVGAFRARSLGFGAIIRATRAYNLLPDREDTGTLFCSELAGSALRYVDRFHTRNCSKWSPVNLCWALERRGVSPGPVEVELPL